MRVILAAAVVSLIALSGCSTSTASPQSEAPTPSVTVQQNTGDLFARTFTVTAYEGSPADVKLLGPVEMTFEEDGWSVTTPCNSHFGSTVTYTPRQIDVSEAGMTAKGCADDLNRQDAFISEFFQEDPTWQLDGSTLVLRAGDSSITAAAS